MPSLLPLRTHVSSPDYDEAVVLDLSSEEADAVFSALSSRTARGILAALYEEPQTASDLAEQLDLSLQNVNYHIKKLRNTELIEVVETWYSETGNEMKVYAPTARAVMVLSDQSTVSRLKDVLRRVLGIFIVLGVTTLVFRTVIMEWILTDTADPDTSPPVAGDPAPAPPEEPAGVLVHLLDPGVVFFLGGLFTLLLVVGFWWIRRR